MGTRRVSGRGVAAILIVTLVGVGPIGCGANAGIPRTGGATPTPGIQAVSATPVLASSTPLAPAIVSTAPASSPIISTSPGTSAAPTVAPADFDAERLYAAVSPAVVAISNRQKSAPNTSAVGEANAGSGTIYDAHGYILTNRHVIVGADSIVVSVMGGKAVVGTLVGQDPVADIAVVKIDPAVVPAVAVFGDSSLVRSGQQVAAIGNPEQFAGSITRGIISGTDRSIGGMDGMVQTDAAISPGSSGGPLVNARGEVIGIASSTIRANQAERIGFAIPGNYARRLAGILVADGKVTRPYLGVTTELLTPGSAVDMKVTVGRGAYVSAVSPNTPAATAGLQKGDVIVAINGTTVDHATPLSVILLDFRPGETVSVTINRDGTERRLTVPLAERPASLDP
ncbi:MAG: S1C family serine protease [Chloroflexota bacterium]|nr:S1C family serine protease [Chloroflexota bacterium]